MVSPEPIGGIISPGSVGFSPKTIVAGDVFNSLCCAVRLAKSTQGSIRIQVVWYWSPNAMSIALRADLIGPCCLSIKPSEEGEYIGENDTIVPSWSWMSCQSRDVNVWALSQVMTDGMPKFLTQPSMKALQQDAASAFCKGIASTQRLVLHTMVNR